MTIAAGFKVRDGVLLCADTEYSGGVKFYDEKIFRHHFNGGSIAVAIAGNGTNAGMAFRDVCYGLTARATPYSPKEVEHAIRRAVKKVYDGYVTGVDESQNAAFDLIIAVNLKGIEPYLLASSNRGVAAVDYFASRGSGWNLSDYIVKHLYDPLTGSLVECAIIALQFLSAAKRYCEGVSGPSQFLTICQGVMRDTFTRDFGVAEEQIHQYERTSARLLFPISDASLDESVIDWHISRFAQEVKQIHATLKSDADWFPQFLKNLIPDPIGRSGPPSPTADPPTPLPSPESPEWSDGS